jgi:hypothetical protein
VVKGKKQKGSEQEVGEEAEGGKLRAERELDPTNDLVLCGPSSRSDYKANL